MRCSNLNADSGLPATEILTEFFSWWCLLPTNGTLSLGYRTNSKWRCNCQNEQRHFKVITDLNASKIARHGTAHKALKLNGTFFCPLCSCLIYQHYLSLLTRTSKSFWSLLKGRKLVCHDLGVTFFNPLGFRRRMHRREKIPPVLGEMTVRSSKPVALLLEECWHALFTTRTDRFPLFCSCLGEGSTSRWFSRDSIKPAYISKWNDLQILLWRR